jgi:hypothetical protein
MAKGGRGATASVSPVMSACNDRQPRLNDGGRRDSTSEAARALKVNGAPLFDRADDRLLTSPEDLAPDRKLHDERSAIVSGFRPHRRVRL